MTWADLDFAAACTEAEGWASETKTEIEAFFALTPSGGYVVEDDGRRVGMCMATAYDGWGFIGELIVLPEARRRGVRVILQDAVPRAMPLYQRAGFKPLCRPLRLRGSPRPRTFSISGA
jgi:GNAT superfamily N-acetyltransferase